VKEPEVGELVERARAELGTGAAARERFRMSLLRRFYEEYGRIHGAGAVRSFDEVERALRAKGYLDRVLKAAWPNVAPDRLVHRLLTSRALLAEAAHEILDDAEQRRLLRRGTGWSDGDIALLDEARTALVEPPHSYGHVIVDEAQDLTPMQLRMVTRRAREGAFTALGDVAQATGPVRYSTWGGILPHLPRGDEATVEELRHAYRVPREIMDITLPLLDVIAPNVAPPISYRTGAEPPTVLRVDEEQLIPEAFRAAAAAPDGLLAVIVPDALADAAPTDELIPVLTPRQAKGLEFDHVVVVEPAAIELRELYVALSRPTKTLTIVHARPLPSELKARNG
jgi:DNA helicase IV